VSDTISLRGLECFAHHGVFPDERRDGQVFVIDLTLSVDTAPAAATDDLTRTVHYGELAMAVKAAVERDPVDLIETVAQRIADVCLAHPLVSRVTVDLHKPHAPIDAVFSDVVVTITRERQERISD